MKLINYFKYRRTILDVDLDESPHTRWANAAQKVGDEIHEIVNEIVSECEAMDTSDWNPWQRLLLWSAKAGGVELGGSLVGVVARLFDQEYPAEIQGMAKAVGVSYLRLLLGSLM